MKIGVAGLGKLGLPVALAIESRGHEVTGYDPNPNIEKYLDGSLPYPHQEAGLQPLLEKNRVKITPSLGILVARSELVFVPVQTPHEPQFEGSTKLPDERADFDYTFLKKAVKDISDTAHELGKRTTLAVISTCLPGTYKKEIKPLLSEEIDYVYTPQFIAMGGVIEDYLTPEFNLVGVESESAADQLERFYATINQAPNVRTDITTAEGIKVSYNTWITAKTVLANAWGEMCDKLGMDFDDMFHAWELSTKRLISPRYMKAGVGDGGGCHPRDNIALSYLADKIGMSHNIWEDLMKAREAHMGWLTEIAQQTAEERQLPIVLLGRSFKPESNIQTGSPGVLASNLLTDRGVCHQHYEDIGGLPQKAVYLITTAHERYREIRFPRGSVVLDPFRIIAPQENVDIMAFGANIVA
jgi:UDPglucose 6-dehydrogenase